jgi:hypothetical protein
VEERKSNKVEPVSEGEIFCFVSQKKNESWREMFMIFDFVIRYYLKTLWCDSSLKKIFLKLIQFFSWKLVIRSPGKKIKWSSFEPCLNNSWGVLTWPFSRKVRWILNWIYCKINIRNFEVKHSKNIFQNCECKKFKWRQWKKNVSIYVP